MNSAIHDVIIIGAGAAGLSAALVLARAQASVLIIDGGQPRNAPALAVHGFLTRDGAAPSDFLAASRREVSRYGGIIREGSVLTAGSRADDAIVITLADGTTEIGRTLLVATGLVDELPRIPGLSARWGSLVHHCPYCHGFEVLGTSIVVIGGAVREASIKQAGLLRSYSDRVTFVTNGIDLTRTERQRLESLNVRVIIKDVSHLIGATAELDGVGLVGGATLDCDAVFIAPRQIPRDGILRDLGCVVDIDTGLVGTDAFGRTSVANVWAAGNVVTPTAQIITAAGAASASAIAINGWLLERKITHVPAHH